MAKKKRYVPGLARLGHRPDFDWSPEEARRLYGQSAHPLLDRIVYADCVPGMEALPAESVDLVVADPPFGIGFSGKEPRYNRARGLVRDGYGEVEGDYRAFSRRWILCLPRIMKASASAYIVSGWTHLSAALDAAAESGLALVNHLIWRYQFGVFTRRKFVSSHYHVLFLVKSPKQYFFNRFEHYPQDVWDIPRAYEPGRAKNGTKLPDALVDRFLMFSSRPGGTVLDPFMGNGTTAACAKALYRRYVGFELNPGVRPLHEERLAALPPGSRYRPLAEGLPAEKDILARYPKLKNHMKRMPGHSGNDK